MKTARRRNGKRKEIKARSERQKMEISVPRVAETALNDAMKATIYTCIVCACKLPFNLLSDQNQSLLSGNKNHLLRRARTACSRAQTHAAQSPSRHSQGGGDYIFVFNIPIQADGRGALSSPPRLRVRHVVHTVIPWVRLGRGSGASRTIRTSTNSGFSSS